MRMPACRITDGMVCAERAVLEHEARALAFGLECETDDRLAFAVEMPLVLEKVRTLDAKHRACHLPAFPEVEADEVAWLVADGSGSKPASQPRRICQGRPDLFYRRLKAALEAHAASCAVDFETAE